MKKIFLNFLIIIIICVFIVACGKPKSRTVVVFHEKNKFFAFGEPHVNYHSNGASLDYFIPGAIVVFRTDQTILNKKGEAGKAYQINKDTVLYEIGKVDTALSDTAIANKYLVFEMEPDTE